jgi:hypothetical protein
LIRCGWEIRYKRVSIIYLENESLSCPNCFTEISYQCERKKNNIAVSKESVNCFEDYFEIYNVYQIRDMITDQQFKEMNITDEEMQFINLKCSNCYNPVGVKDTLNKYFIFFNAI